MSIENKSATVSFAPANGVGEAVQFTGTEIRIGRSHSANQVFLSEDDQLSSREHATLKYSSGRWSIEDHSRNGSWVNGKWFKDKRVALKTGDHIKIGKYFDVVFYDLKATGAATTKPVTMDLDIGGKTSEELSHPQHGLWLSPSGHIYQNGAPLSTPLSTNEYKLLGFLVKNRGKLCSYDELMRVVWEGEREKRHVHELVSRIRRKIGDRDDANRLIHFQPGRGVVLMD